MLAIVSINCPVMKISVLSVRRIRRFRQGPSILREIRVTRPLLPTLSGSRQHSSISAVMYLNTGHDLVALQVQEPRQRSIQPCRLRVRLVLQIVKRVVLGG